MAAAAVILSAFPNQAFAAQHSFVISIRTLHDSFKSGAEIRVGVTLTNTSDKDIFLPGPCVPRADVDGFTIKVEDAQGKVPHETDLLRWRRGEPAPEPKVFTTDPNSSGCVVLRPKQSSDRVFVLSSFYDLTKPGKYKIRVQRIDPTSKVTVQSNTITVTVTQ